MSALTAFISGFAGGILGGIIICELFWREVRGVLKDALIELGLLRGEDDE